MILHLLSDDKFTDYVIEQFEKLIPGQNEYLVLIWDNKKSVTFIKNRDRIITIQEESKELNKYCNNLSRFDAIVTHNLSTPSQEKVVLSAPDTVKIAWVFWGFEIYNRKENRNNYFGRQTKKLSYRYWIRSQMKSTYRLVKTGQRDKQIFQVSAKTFQKVDYCLTHLKEDYHFAKEYFNGNFNFLWYNYFSIDKTLGKLKNKKVNGNNILVGNSATLSNNHLEVIDLLKNIELNTREIIVPLSYGNNKYASYIKKKGEKVFGNRFVPLTVFMDRTKYNSLLQTCSIVIMHHFRQQALGNIITSLWLGAKVFLSEQTITFSYFKRLEIHIFSIEKDLNPDNKELLDPLPDELVEHNRKILLVEYGKEAMNTRIAELINTLTN